MPKKIMTLTGGIAFIFFGLMALLLQLESGLGSDDSFYIVIIIFFLPLFIGIVGLFLLGRVGRLGRIGLGISLLGLVLISSSLLLSDLLADLSWGIFLACLLSIPVGVAIYGLAALRSKPLQRGNLLPILCAGLLVVLFAGDWSWSGWISQSLVFLTGLSWVGFGYALVLSRTEAPEADSQVRRSPRMALLGGVGLVVCVLGIQGFVWRSNAAFTTCPPPIAAIPVLSGAPRPVIVDVDMAHEDMNAILYLLQNPQVDVKAVTVAGTGEAHCEAGVRNARGLLAMHGRPDIPVACGPEMPMTGDHVFPDEWRQAADDLYGLSLPEKPAPATALQAPDLIASTVKESPGQVTVVATGPLTNLGQALVADPSIAERIDGIFIMGGAVELGGNVGMSGVGIENNVAEWNIFIDPHAASLVFHSGVPITLVPLNATRHAPVTGDFYSCIQENRTTPEAEFVFDILRANYDFVSSGGFQFWDSLTAGIFTDESLAEFKTMNLIVVEQEGPANGQTRPDKDGIPVRVAVSADGERFESLLLEVLNLQDEY
jgi:inosine-uridine nucleoside N-ribohydrolase